jgi:PmbA protein
MPPLALAPVEEMVARLDRALAGSPADATELVWIEARRHQESTGKGRRDGDAPQERTVLVRVREAGRVGLHRTGLAGLADLEKAVREALAQARLAPKAPPARSPAGSGDAPAKNPGLCDEEIRRLTPVRAQELLQRSAGGAAARLGWAEGRFAVVNSRGLRRAAEVTAAWLEVGYGNSPGAGSAAAVARSLAGLDVPAVFERARQRHAPQAAADAAPPDGPVPMVLAPEAAAALLALLNCHALSSLSFLDGVSFLRERTGQAVFHPALTLRDDPGATEGAPFPFDLFGAAKRPMVLVEHGVFLGAARDERLADVLGQPPTAHLVAPDEARCSHLSLQPGPQPDGELLRQAEGGVWVGELDDVAAFDPRSLRFRALCRGVRRIVSGGNSGGGALGPALPDLVWEGCLPDLLAHVLGVGNLAVPVPAGDPLLGATSAPLLACSAVEGLRLQPLRS